MRDFPSYVPRRDAQWSDIEYRQLPFAGPAIERYRDALRGVFTNGDVRYAAFEAINRDDFLSAQAFHHCTSHEVIETFLEREEVRTVFTYKLASSDWNDAEIFYQGHRQFRGLMADLILQGGIYGRWMGSSQEGEKLAEEAWAEVQTLSLDGPWGPWHVSGPWCRFFMDAATDHTLLVMFPYDARWFILCATDTD